MSNLFKDFKFSTLVELLRYRVLHQPDQVAFTFLQDGETEEINLTYQQLDRQALAIAAYLQSLGISGERALLLYPPGLDFISAFFGCLAAGVVAVPAYPPRPNQSLSRFQAIVADAQATIVLTTTTILSNLERQNAQSSALQALSWLATDNINSDLAQAWQKPVVSCDTLAFLQYTSGSTGTPKGVMVSHGNLLHNEQIIQQAMQHTEKTIFVGWLPLFHDMGLIGNMLQPLYLGIPCILMSPVAFLQKPWRWLQAISRYKATTSGGPNFAYDLCVSKITPEQRTTLDLSSWEVAFNGAEPIRSETLDRFAATFEPCGFRREAFYPCYGMAETTLIVSGGLKTALPIIRFCQGADLEQNRVITAASYQEGIRVIVGCGQTCLDQEVVIVNPEFLTPCPTGQVGEIWVSGPSVAQGYWNQPLLTEQTFHAYLADTNRGPFLRTGDLGFLQDGELFVTGRLKDLIIILGRNHYPQDIEVTVEQSHPALRKNCGAAFSVEIAAQEKLVVVQEIERSYLRKLNVDEVIGAIRQAVAEQHDLQVYAVVLLKTASLPKTSSGKLQRNACRASFLAGSLDVVADWSVNPRYQNKFKHLDVEVESLLQQMQAGKLQGDILESNSSQYGSVKGEREKGKGLTLSFSPTPVPLSQTATEEDECLTEQYCNSSNPPAKSQPKSHRAEVIQAWLISKVAEQLEIAPDQIDTRQPFAYYGLSSLAAINISGEAQEWLESPFSPTLLYDYPTIETLSQYLAKDAASDLRSQGSTPPDIDFGGNQRETETEAIAIIGLSCRFPGAKDPESFWQLLRNGVDAIKEVPPSRWDASAFYSPTPATPGKMNTLWGGFIEQVDQFDPQFFGISPREAESMDPQQRLLLEVSWEALERSGQVPEQLAGSYTGVFIGISSNDYSQLQFNHPVGTNSYSGTGNALSIAANRLSYLLDLRGPSWAVDTACSSSLVAVHQAIMSLRQKECQLALVGGVNLILTPQLTITFSHAGMMAADGRCKTFDASADGYVRGEGCGVVILKRLSDAQRDGDRILAVIRGSAVNQDGRSNGLTAPNGPSQQAVIRQALENAGVAPAQINYVEAHGTGTSLGDPIEVNSLKEVLMAGRSSNQHCWIGSVKTNIGHLEASAGIASLIKVVLSLQHGEIPPHLHFININPYINLEDTPLSIPTELQKWFTGKERRLAGVSSFGFGGTNAHVILEEASAPVPIVANECPKHLLTLSAKSEKALRELAQNYEEFLASNPETSIADICFTANTKRSHFDHRLAIIAESSIQLQEALNAFAAVRETAGLVSNSLEGSDRPKIAFLFTGQGFQYVGMGKQLYEQVPTFRQILDRANEILRPYLEKPLLEVLYPATKESSLLDETVYTQPALFALEYGLFELWKSWGIKPDVVMGHSVGEYVAACVAGVFSFEDGLKLIAERARLMQTLPQDGEMVAVQADEHKVALAIQPYAHEVAIAAINGPESLVISGKCQAIRSVQTTLEAMGVKQKQLQVSHAFHSPLMEPMLPAFFQFAKKITYSLPQIQLISNVTGSLVTDEIATPEYWCRHVRQCVEFAAGMETLRRQGYEVFVEIGPRPGLLGMGCHCIPENGRVWLPSLRPGQDDWQQMLESLAQLYIRGVSVDWEGFEQDYHHYQVILPTYPFQRQRYWVETSKNGHLQLESSSSTIVQTPIVNLLQQGDTEQLTRLLKKAGNFSEEQRNFVSELLEVLVKQHQQQIDFASIQNWLYEVEWQPKSRQFTEISFTEPGSWLIMAHLEGVGQALSVLLQEHGQNCILVYAGDIYQAKEPGTWSLNPSNPAHFIRLFQEVVSTTSKPPLKGVIHLWSSEARLTSELSLNSLEHIQVLGCGSTLHLVQALVSHYQLVAPRLWLVTRGAVPVDSSLPGLAQASLWGLGKVIALEHPELWGGLIDLAPDAPANEAVNILAEILDSQGEDQLVFREEQRYVARLVRSQVATEVLVSLKPDSTYLITGGLGALGLKVAQWMVEHGARYLVLMGRREPSEKALQAIAQMKQAGAKVFLAQADVANYQDMVKVLEQVQQSMPPIQGIVHAAGVLDDGILLQQDWGRFTKVMAPKVNGAWNLHVLTQEMPLDFFVNFSSAASLLGSPGQGNYAAANAFMDALAHYRRALGLPGLSINWGPWSDVGMAASLSSRERGRFTAQGMESIPLEHGLSVLKQLLGQSSSQVGVLPIEWSVFRQQFSGVTQLPLLSELLGSLKSSQEEQQPSAQQHELLQRLEAALPSDRHFLLINHIQSEVANVLKLDSSQLPDPQQGFFDMGMDSLMAVELKNRLDASLGCSLPTTLAFESPTIKDLAEYLAQEVLRWESPTTGDPELIQGGDKVLSEVEQLPEDEIEASITEKLSKLESLLKNN